jgi:hypothetical protein
MIKTSITGKSKEKHRIKKIEKILGNNVNNLSNCIIDIVNRNI